MSTPTRKSLHYDDERTVHSESGGFIWFPADLCDRGPAIAEVAHMAGASFREFTATKVYMVTAPPEETPDGYDAWWTVVNRRHPGAVAFWEVRGVGVPRSHEPKLNPALEEVSGG
jgi:hypothetical protein